jgi:hypothetical protein
VGPAENKRAECRLWRIELHLICLRGRLEQGNIRTVSRSRHYGREASCGVTAEDQILSLIPRSISTETDSLQIWDRRRIWLSTEQTLQSYNLSRLVSIE